MERRLLVACALLSMSTQAEPRDIGELIPRGVIRLGKTADWVAVAADAVWVASTGPYAVHRIDPGTTTRIATVALPGEPCAGLALGFGALWVPLCAPKSGGQAGLARVNLATGLLEVVYPVKPAAREGGIAVSDDSVWLMVDAQGTLARLEPVSGTLRERIRIAPGSFNPRHESGTLFVTQAAGDQVTIVDARSGRIEHAVRTGSHPRFLTSGGGAVWTLNQGDGSVSRLDLATHAIERIALDTPGHGGDIGFENGHVWSTMPTVPLSLIDAASRRVVCQWRGPGGDSLGLGFGSVWLTDYHGGTVSRIDINDALRRCKDE